MKDKRNQYIKNIALRIAYLEQNLQLGKDVKENQQKIQNIMSSLSIEEMILVDDYITRKKLLTK